MLERVWKKGTLLHLRKSISRYIDKKSQVPEEERGVWNSQGEKKDKNTFLSLSHIKLFFFFPLSPELVIAQQNNPG